MSKTTNEELPLESSLRRFFRMVLRDHKALNVGLMVLAIDISLTFGIGYDTVHLHTLSNSAQRVACVESNRLRASEKQLWEYIFEKTEPRHPTVAEVKAYEGFYHYLNKSLRPRDCSVLQSGPLP